MDDDCPAAPLYLDLLKRTLTRLLTGDDLLAFAPSPGSYGEYLWADVTRRELGEDVVLARRPPFDPARREEGRDWPASAETMIGLRRLDNVQHCVESVLADGVPGDLAETGVWRGGTAIFMRGLLAAYGDRDRAVWVADSFRGLPEPDGDTHPADRGDRHHSRRELAVSRAQVEDNFRRYGLLDERVRFLEGWFEDTLASAPIERLAVLRLDGDMYGSTIVALDALYDRLSPGGYLIVDDYGAVPGCRKAVEDFRGQRGISEPIEPVDWTGAYWRKQG